MSYLSANKPFDHVTRKIMKLSVIITRVIFKKIHKFIIIEEEPTSYFVPPVILFPKSSSFAR